MKSNLIAAPLAVAALLTPLALLAGDNHIYGTDATSTPSASGFKAENKTLATQKTSMPSSIRMKPVGGAAKPLSPPSKATLNLIEALRAGNFDMAEIALQQGGDINCKNCNYSGAPPLMALYGNVEGHEPSPTLVWMLAHGANPNQSDKNGTTLMMMMAAGQQITNPFFSGIDDFLYLADSGANASLADNNGDTALHYLASNKVKDPDEFKDWKGGLGDFSYQVLDKGLKQWVLAFDKLIEKGVNINAVNRFGVSPLMVVSDKCTPFVVNLFLSKGADPAVKSKTGETALSLAIDTASRTASKSCNKVVEILKEPLHNRR